MRTEGVFEYLQLYTTRKRVRASSKDYERMLDLWQSFEEGEKRFVNRVLKDTLKPE